MRATLILLLSSVALVACSKTVPRLRWAEGSAPTAEPGAPALSISSIAAGPSAPLTLKDLPERSGAAYATAVAAKTKTSDDYIRTLAAPIKGPARSDQDRTTLQRVIAIDVAPGGYSAGKRLVRTQVIIEPAGPFRFANYTFAKTEYQTIDLETVTSTRKTTGSITLKPELGNVIEAGEAGVGFENTDQTVYGNRERLKDLSVAFYPERIIITRDGAPNADLSGLTILKASVKPQPDPPANGAGANAPVNPATTVFLESLVTDQKLFRDDGGDAKPSAASITTSIDRIWERQPLLVCARLDYVERTVVEGQQFFDEGQQRIVEQAHSTPARYYELVSDDDVETLRFGIYDMAGNEFLQLDGPTGARPFSFTDLIAATTFAEWVWRTGANRVGQRALKISGRQIMPLKGRQLDVRRLGGGATTQARRPGEPCKLNEN